MIRGLLGAFALAACHEAASPPPPEAPADPVAWTPAVPAGVFVLARLPGEVVHAPGGSQHLAPRLPLRVVRWEVRPGDRVVAGQALATVSAPLLDGLAEEVAARRAAREAAIARVDAGVGNRGEVAAAEADLAAVDAQWQATRGDLTRAGRGWTWRAPSDGTVQAISCAPGEPLDPATPCVEVVGGEAARVVVHVPEHLIPTLISPTGRFWASGVTDPVPLSWEANAPALHPASRTRTAWLVAPPDAPGANDTLLVGRSGRVDVLVPAPEGAVVVPSPALTRIHGADVLFVQGQEEPVAVQILAREGESVVVRGDLAPGQPVASRGVLLLKARLAMEDN